MSGSGACPTMARKIRRRGPRPRLLEVARETIRRRHFSYRTEETYLHWIKRFILFSGKRHPRELGAVEVTAFLNHLALERLVAGARCLVTSFVTSSLFFGVRATRTRL